jgi:hypothetical protein
MLPPVVTRRWIDVMPDSLPGAPPWLVTPSSSHGIAVGSTAPDDHVEPYDLPEQLGGASPSAAPPVELPAVAVDAGTTFRPIAEELRELERRRMASRPGPHS